MSWAAFPVPWGKPPGYLGNFARIQTPTRITAYQLPREASRPKSQTVVNSTGPGSCLSITGLDRVGTSPVPPETLHVSIVSPGLSSDSHVTTMRSRKLANQFWFRISRQYGYHFFLIV